MNEHSDSCKFRRAVTLLTSFFVLLSVTSCTTTQQISQLESHIAKAKQLQSQKQVQEASSECAKAIDSAEGEDDVRLIELLNDQADLESQVAPERVKATIMRAEDICDRYQATHETETTKAWLEQCVRTYSKMAEVHRGLGSIGMAKANYLKGMKIESKLGIKPEESKLQAKYIEMLKGRAQEGDTIVVARKSATSKERAEFKKRLFSIENKPGELCNVDQLTALYEEARRKYDIEDSNYQTARSLVLACYNARKRYDKSILLLTRDLEVLKPAEAQMDAKDPGEDVVVRAQMLVQTLFDLGTVLRSADRLHDAAKIFRRHIDLCKKTKSTDIVFGLYSLADIEMQQNNPKAGAELCQQAVEIANKHHMSREILTTIYARQAIAYARWNRPDLARASFASAQRLAPKTSSSLYNAAMEIASALMRLCSYSEALQMNRVARSCLSPNETVAEMDSAIQMANLKELLGDLKTAEAELTSIAKRAAKENDTVREAKALFRLACILRDRGQLTDASKTLSHAIEHANLLKDFPKDVLINLYAADGEIRTLNNDFDKASKSFAKAVELERSIHKNGIEVAMLLTRAASTLSLSSKRGEANKAVDEAVAIIEKVQDKNKVVEKLYVFSQAIVVYHTNHDDKTKRDYWKKTLEFFRENEPEIKKRSIEDHYLVWLADNAFRAGDLKSAQEFYENYFASDRQHDAVTAYQTQERYALLLKKSGDSEKAKTAQNKCEQMRIKLGIPKPTKTLDQI